MNGARSALEAAHLAQSRWRFVQALMSVWPRCMEFLACLVRCLIELAALGSALVTNSFHFLALCTKNRTTRTAENRKQLAFYQERNVVPRRFDNAPRYLLVLLSRCFDWQDALVNVTPKTLIGWHRKGFGCSGVGDAGVDDRECPLNYRTRPCPLR